jgi:hypothetical protein
MANCALVAILSAPQERKQPFMTLVLTNYWFFFVVMPSPKEMWLFSATHNL